MNSLTPHAKQLNNCTYCPKLCRQTCPVSNMTGKETLTPQSKMHVLNMLRRNAIEWTSEASELFYGCTGCRLCTSYCGHENDVPQVLWDGRAEAVARGFIHPALTDFSDRFRRRNRELSAKLRALLAPKELAQKGEIAYFPGCDTIETSPDTIIDAVRIFHSMGSANVRVMSPPTTCMGYPLWAAGLREAAQFAAQEVIKRIRQFSTVIVDCPACAYLMRDRIPQRGYDHNTKIISSAEFLMDRINTLRFRRKIPSLIYHDSCYLGRYLRVYDQPRHLLAQCTDSVREFFHAFDKSECCGGGGLVPITLPEVTERQARHRLAEAELFDETVLISACATCNRTLNKIDSPVTATHLISMIAWGLELRDTLPVAGPNISSK